MPSCVYHQGVTRVIDVSESAQELQLVSGAPASWHGGLCGDWSSVVRWRNLGSLEQELLSFGVRGRELSAARLKALPELLCVLYGQENLADAEAELAAADHVAAMMSGFIESLRDPTEKRVAQAIWAGTPDFQGKSIEVRQHLLRGFGVGPTLYRELRKRLTNDLADELRRSLSPPDERTPRLSPSTVPMARQLYRYAQESLLFVEAYDTMAIAAQQLELSRTTTELVLANIGGRTTYSELSLWSHAMCLHFFRALVAEPDGRAFLRTGLPTAWWVMKLSLPFGESDQAVIEQALAETEDATEFFVALRELEADRGVVRRWFALLGNPSRGSSDFDLGSDDREDVRTRLVALCQFFESVFPSDARPLLESLQRYDAILFYLLDPVVPVAEGIEDAAYAAHVRAVLDQARLCRPDRYLFGRSERPSIRI